MSINTFAVFSFIKFEHAYINQFIEHHLNIGFSYFYLIVDNLDINNIQEDYNLVIKEEFKPYIKLYDIRETIITGDTHSNLIEYFNQIILPDIKEDWVLPIGGDAFIYLDGMQINKYVEKVESEHGKIFQILFPHFFCLNILDNNTDLVNTNNLFTTKSIALFFTLGRVNNIKVLHKNSHILLSKTQEQLIYIPNKNKCIIINDNNETNNMARFFMDTYLDIFDNSSKIFIIHFYLRSYNELLIKNILYWDNESVIKKKKRDMTNLILQCCSELSDNKFVEYINNSNFPRLRILFLYTYKSLNIHLTNENYISFTNKFNKTISNKNRDLHINKYNEDLISSLLKELGISNEQWELFKEKLRNVIRRIKLT